MYDKTHMLVMDYHENTVHTLLRERELNLFIRKTRVQSTHLMGSSCGFLFLRNSLMQCYPVEVEWYSECLVCIWLICEAY